MENDDVYKCIYIFYVMLLFLSFDENSIIKQFDTLVESISQYIYNMESVKYIATLSTFHLFN